MRNNFIISLLSVGVPLLAEPANNGVFYPRYMKLGAILKVTDGKRNVDIINARRKYEEYQVEQ